MFLEISVSWSLFIVGVTLFKKDCKTAVLLKNLRNIQEQLFFTEHLRRGRYLAKAL